MLLENISLPKEDDIFRIVFCGKITIQKNPEFFKEIALHYKEDSSVSFTWIGDGEMNNELQSDAITITGWKSKKGLYSILDNSDLYLSTSSWEGLSLATIEASAFGLPLLLSRCTGNVDMIEQGVNGFLFDTKEDAIRQIEYLRSNPEKRNLISKNSSKIYDNIYGNFRCGLEYKKLYLEIQARRNNSKKS